MKLLEKRLDAQTSVESVNRAEVVEWKSVQEGYLQRQGSGG